MIVAPLIVLFSLIGNKMSVNHIPTSKTAKICINKHKNDTDCYQNMELTYMSSYPYVYNYNLSENCVKECNYFKIKFYLNNKETIHSNWIKLNEKAVCTDSNCKGFLIGLVLTISISICIIICTILLLLKNKSY